MKRRPARHTCSCRPARVGPLLMTFLLLRVSGVVLLERSIGKRRPAYAEYAARTSAFIPMPPRRAVR